MPNRPLMAIVSPVRVNFVPTMLVPKLPSTTISLWALIAAGTNPEKVIIPPPLEDALVKMKSPELEPVTPALRTPAATTGHGLRRPVAAAPDAACGG